MLTPREARDAAGRLVLQAERLGWPSVVLPLDVVRVLLDALTHADQDAVSYALRAEEVAVLERSLRAARDNNKGKQ